LSKYGFAVNRIKLKCDNDREYTLTRHLYHYIVNAYYDGLIDGVECDEAMYLIIDVGSYRLRLHVDSAFFIGDIVLESFVSGAYDDLDVGEDCCGCWRWRGRYGHFVLTARREKGCCP
jgi:hypothetical protein